MISNTAMGRFYFIQVAVPACPAPAQSDWSGVRFRPEA